MIRIYNKITRLVSLDFVLHDFYNETGLNRFIGSCQEHGCLNFLFIIIIIMSFFFFIPKLPNSVTFHVVHFYLRILQFCPRFLHHWIKGPIIGLALTGKNNISNYWLISAFCFSSVWISLAWHWHPTLCLTPGRSTYPCPSRCQSCTEVRHRCIRNSRPSSSIQSKPDLPPQDLSMILHTQQVNRFVNIDGCLNRLRILSFICSQDSWNFLMSVLLPSVSHKIDH